MNGILTIGVLGVCLYGVMSVLGFLNILMLRYIIRIEDESLQTARRSLATIIYIFVASCLKLIFYLGMIVTENVEIGFYVVYKIAAFLLLMAVLLISKQLITIGGLIDINFPLYILSYLTFIVFSLTTIFSMIVGGIKGIPSTSTELEEEKFKITLYFDASNELIRTGITILSLSISSIWLYSYIHRVIVQNRERIPVLDIEDDENEDESKIDGTEDKKEIGEDDDLRSVLRNLKIFIIYIFCTQTSALITVALKLSDVSDIHRYAATAFAFGDFLPDGGFIVAALYLARGARSHKSYMLVRSNELYDRLHPRCHHSSYKEISKHSHRQHEHHDDKSQVVEHYFSGASIFGFSDTH